MNGLLRHLEHQAAKITADLLAMLAGAASLTCFGVRVARIRSGLVLVAHAVVVLCGNVVAGIVGFLEFLD